MTKKCEVNQRPICKLCHKYCEKFAKSHIISRGFFTNTLISRGTNQSVWDMESFCGSGEGRKLRNALYDCSMLCQTCEHNIFAPLDQYAIRVYRDFNNAAFLDLSDMSRGLKATAKAQGIEEAKFILIQGVNRHLLRAFFASLLWRCHASSLIELKAINIGQTYEERIRNDLLSNGAFEYVDAIAFSLTSLAHECLIMPVKKRFDVDGRQANGYTIQLPHLEFRVSLDQRNNPYDFGVVNFGEYGTSKWEGAMSLRKEYDTEKLLIFQTREALHQWRCIRNEFRKYFTNNPQRNKHLIMTK